MAVRLSSSSLPKLVYRQARVELAGHDHQTGEIGGLVDPVGVVTFASLLAAEAAVLVHQVPGQPDEIATVGQASDRIGRRGGGRAGGAGPVDHPGWKEARRSPENIMLAYAPTSGGEVLSARPRPTGECWSTTAGATSRSSSTRCRRRVSGPRWTNFSTTTCSIGSTSSLMLEAGVPIVTVSRRLAHRRVSTTLDHYAHSVPGGEAHASATLRLVIEAAGTGSRDAESAVVERGSDEQGRNGRRSEP